MSRLAAALVVACLCVGGATAPMTVTATNPDAPSIVATVPNPVADGDAGETVVVRAPPLTNLSQYVLADGESRVRLPNRTVTGEFVLTATPARVRNRTDRRVLRVALPALSNAGERLRLLRDNQTVSTLRYEDAPEGERLRNGTWRHIGATDHPVVTGGAGTARAFVLPDAPEPPLAPIRNATDRVLLAGYTFTSKRVTDALVAAAERGATVRVLVEGGPVGGISRAQARQLDRLTAAGVSVRVVTGPHARYAYHHAKYAVADNQAVVLTENWKPAGVGGRSSRGWGAVVADPGIVSGLVRLFDGDFEWRAARAWREYRRGRTFTVGETANGTYQTRTEPARVSYQNASLLVAPDNAGRALAGRLRRANDSIRVLQLSIDSPDGRFVRALLDAARRGVTVRVLLASAWYVREDNAAVAEQLNAAADREGLDLRVRLAEPRGYEKVHAKGVVVDDSVVLGSLNWNRESVRQNREVLLALEGEAVADYYRTVFDADWRASSGAASERTRIPLGLVTALGVGAAVCLLAARRLSFE